ncbi:hypothetical protein EBU24_05880 [bacterium]|nr:hypothetical protein [bacterium]
MLPLLVPALAQAGIGAIQAATSGAGKAQKDFENFAKKRPVAEESKSLNDYYQRSLSEVNQNPYQSAQYLISKQEADRRLASGIGAMQGRGGALNAISKLDLMRTDAQNQAIRNAENLRGQNLNRLGQATQMKTAQDRYLYDVNQATPFNTMLGIKQMKLAAANERLNAGLSMIGGAASNYMLGSIYGSGAGAAKKTISATPSTLTSNIPGSPYGKFSSLSSLGTNLGGFKSAFGKTYQNNLGGLPQVNNYPAIEGQSFYPEY